MCPSGKVKVCSAAPRGGAPDGDGPPRLGTAPVGVGPGVAVVAGGGVVAGVEVSTGAVAESCASACGSAQAAPTRSNPANRGATASERSRVRDSNVAPK